MNVLTLKAPLPFHWIQKILVFLFFHSSESMTWKTGRKEIVAWQIRPVSASVHCEVNSQLHLQVGSVPATSNLKGSGCVLSHCQSHERDLDLGTPA